MIGIISVFVFMVDSDSGIIFNYFVFPNQPAMFCVFRLNFIEILIDTDDFKIRDFKYFLFFACKQ